jgi:hypothetical protein
MYTDGKHGRDSTGSDRDASIKRARHATVSAASHASPVGIMAHLPSPALVAIMNCFVVLDVLCKLARVNRHWNRHARAPMSFEYATWNTESLCGSHIGVCASPIGLMEELRFAAIEARWCKYAPMMHSLFVEVRQGSSSPDDNEHNYGPSSSDSDVPWGSPAIDSHAVIASRIMVAHPSIFGRLVSIYICDRRIISPLALTAFDVNIPAMANVRVAVVDFIMSDRIYGAEIAFTYAFASSPQLRDLTLIDVYNQLHESYIQSILEPHAATLEVLTVNVSCNASRNSSSNGIAKWLYPVCRMRALKSLKFVDAHEFTMWNDTPMSGAFIACLARIHTLEKLSIHQWVKNSRSAYALSVISTQQCARVGPIALRLDADGFTTDGAFRSLVHLDVPAMYVDSASISIVANAFPVLQQLTLATYDSIAGVIMPAMFAEMPSLHCITYMREGPFAVCGAYTVSSSMAEISHSLLLLPEPLHVSVVQIERVCWVGMFATVRPRVAMQAEPGVMHVYSASTPSMTPGAFLPGAQSLRLALGNISSAAVHSPHCLSSCLIHKPVHLLSATLLVVSHMGRVPDCARPLLLLRA